MKPQQSKAIKNYKTWITYSYNSALLTHENNDCLRTFKIIELINSNQRISVEEVLELDGGNVFHDGRSCSSRSINSKTLLLRWLSGF